MPFHISISGFQSIEDIDFTVEGYTALTGPSNSGKSAICRAIEGALFNRTGDEFVRRGVKSSRVVITTDNGHTIEWVKGSKNNYYKIDGDLYDKVGSDTPQPLKEIGFSEVVAGNRKFRPQMGTDQFDVLFLVRESGATIAELFSILAKLDLISKAGKECTSDLKSSKSILKTRQGDLVKVERQLVRYENFDVLYGDLHSVQDDFNSIKTASTDIEMYKDMLARRRLLVGELKNLKATKNVTIPEAPPEEEVSTLAKMRGILSLRGRISKELTALRTVSEIPVPSDPPEDLVKTVKLLSSIVDQRYKLTDSIEILVPVKEIVVPEVPDYDSVMDLRNLKDRRSKILSEVSELEDNLSRTENQVKVLHQDLESLMGDLKECPLCETPIKGRKVAVWAE